MYQSKLEAYCESIKCRKAYSVKKYKQNLQIRQFKVKKDVNFTTKICPDCGGELIWKKNRRT